MYKNINQFFIKRKFFFTGMSLAFIFMILDLYSKYYIFNLLNNLQLSEVIYYPVLEITSFFNLVQVLNNGVSFGMFSELDNARIFIIILNILIIIALIVWLFRNKYQYLMISLSFIIGGALGNLADRIINGAVADFLDFHMYNYHWPAFNLADSFVFIGVTMLLLENFFIKKDEK